MFKQREYIKGNLFSYTSFMLLILSTLTFKPTPCIADRAAETQFNAFLSQIDSAPIDGANSLTNVLRWMRFLISQGYSVNSREVETLRMALEQNLNKHLLSDLSVRDLDTLGVELVNFKEALVLYQRNPQYAGELIEAGSELDRLYSLTNRVLDFTRDEIDNTYARLFSQNPTVATDFRNQSHMPYERTLVADPLERRLVELQKLRRQTADEEDFHRNLGPAVARIQFDMANFTAKDSELLPSVEMQQSALSIAGFLIDHTEPTDLRAHLFTHRLLDFVLAHTDNSQTFIDAAISRLSNLELNDHFLDDVLGTRLNEFALRRNLTEREQAKFIDEIKEGIRKKTAAPYAAFNRNFLNQKELLRDAQTLVRVFESLSELPEIELVPKKSETEATSDLKGVTPKPDNEATQPAAASKEEQIKRLLPREPERLKPFWKEVFAKLNLSNNNGPDALKVEKLLNWIQQTYPEDTIENRQIKAQIFDEAIDFIQRTLHSRFGNDFANEPHSQLVLLRGADGTYNAFSTSTAPQSRWIDLREHLKTSSQFLKRDGRLRGVALKAMRTLGRGLRTATKAGAGCLVQFLLMASQN